MVMHTILNFGSIVAKAAGPTHRQSRTMGIICEVPDSQCGRKADDFKCAGSYARMGACSVHRSYQNCAFQKFRSG